MFFLLVLALVLLIGDSALTVPTNYTVSARGDSAALHTWYPGDCAGETIEVEKRIPPGPWIAIAQASCGDGGLGPTTGLVDTDLVLFRAHVSGNSNYTPIIPTLRHFGSRISDAAAAALVVDTIENRSGNVPKNATDATTQQINDWRTAQSSFPNKDYVTGAGAAALIAAGKLTSTDNLIQWASFKWGIPPEVGRAQMHIESGWNQLFNGDSSDVRHPGTYPAGGLAPNIVSQYPVQARIDADSVYESMGISQIKFRPPGHPDGTVGLGTNDVRWQSTSFNLDVWGASVRYYYDGHATWITDRTDHRAAPAPPWPPYIDNQPNDPWLSLSAHYSPSPWSNAQQMSYAVDPVGYGNYANTPSYIRDRLISRPWTAPGFAN